MEEFFHLISFIPYGYAAAAAKFLSTCKHLFMFSMCSVCILFITFLKYMA